MERLWFIASLAEVLADREDFSLIRMHAPAGDQPPLHVHEREDEGFYVLSGSVTLWVGDADPVTLVPGEYALAPHGIPHTYRVGDSAATFLVTSTPGAFAAFVREAGRPATNALAAGPRGPARRRAPGPRSPPTTASPSSALRAPSPPPSPRLLKRGQSLFRFGHGAEPRPAPTARSEHLNGDRPRLGPL